MKNNAPKDGIENWNIKEKPLPPRLRDDIEIPDAAALIASLGKPPK